MKAEKTHNPAGVRTEVAAAKVRGIHTLRFVPAIRLLITTTCLVVVCQRITLHYLNDQFKIKMTV